MTDSPDSPAGADPTGTGADPLTPNQRAWVNALRSGDYKQGLNHLTVNDRHCCLGVACALAIEDGVKVVVEETQDGRRIYDGEGSHPPSSVTEWLGLRAASAGYGELGESLVDTNDSGVPFDEIAGLIEQYADDLFVKRSA